MPPISEAKLAANRENAKKSTGPRTVEGKERSRQNALKHGMAAGVVVAEEMREEVEERIKSWTEALRPQTEPEEWLVSRAAIDAVRADAAASCERARTEARIRNDALYARAQGIGEAGAESLGGQLLKASARQVDPLLVRLRGTRAGCEWLLKRWRDLARRHKARGFWSGHEFFLAQWLSGGEYVEHIDDHGTMTAPMARLCVDFLLSAPGGVEKNAEVASMIQRAAWDLDAMLTADGEPGSPESVYAANRRLVAFVAARIDEVEARLAVLAESDSLDESLSADRLRVDLSAEGKLLHRYESDLVRRVHQSLDQLARIRKSAPQDENMSARPARPEGSRSQTSSKAPQRFRKGSRNEAKAPGTPPPSLRPYRMPTVPESPSQPVPPHLLSPPILANPRTTPSSILSSLPPDPAARLRQIRDTMLDKLNQESPGLIEGVATLATQGD